MTILLAVVSLGIFAQPVHALSGAIFTTDKNGHQVNGNIYKDKCDVYLDGGPGEMAPVSSASLPEGWYYFQVTDPSGKELLSTDDISDRQFYVNINGVITAAISHPTNEDKGEGKDYGAVVVQLCPYSDTPNNGGVYKVWVTRQEDYNPGSGRHGFIPALCKTDNFKVAKKPPEQYLTVKKFKDCNANGLPDDGPQQWISGWGLLITPPNNPVIDDEVTPYSEWAWPGLWTVQELPRDNWIQTGLIIDGISQDVVSDTATVTFGTQDETHTVIFGNIPTGCIIVCKFYDSNGDGIQDPDEPGIHGVKMTLTGRDVIADLTDPPIEGDNVEILAYTGELGCVTFDDLLPGTYIVTEEVPTNCEWKSTTPTTSNEILLGCDEGAEGSAKFGNIITGTACFSTKGYWHNKNGLTELTDADIAHVNGLDPYSSPSSYFDDGDEPFDGMFGDGSPVDAAIGDGIWQGVAVAPAGSAKAEVSQFLVDSNAGGDPREQLAQQLLAFIFNVRHRLDGGEDAVIFVVLVPGGEEEAIVAGDLINAAIEIWENGSAADQTEIKDILDGLNNRECDPGVEYILPSPGFCAPVPHSDETPWPLLP